MSKTIRLIKVWHTDTLEITWDRIGRDGLTEHLVQRITCPPDETWKVRAAEQAVSQPAEGDSER